MKGWSTYLLGEAPLEIIDGDRGKNYPSEGELLENGDCLFLSTKNVRKHGFDFTSCQFITSEKDRLLRKGKLKINDLVLTTRGTVGNIALYNDNNKYDNVRINSGMVIIRPRIEKIYPTYLFYTFKFLQSEWDLVVSGSAQPQLPIKDIKNIQLSIPPMAEQRAIAAVLSNLDDKIDLLLRQNATLEAMAEALFRQWFVVDAKEEWEEGQLYDLFELQRGFDLPVHKRQHGNISIISSSGVTGYHSEHMVKGPGVVIGRSGVLGNVFYLKDNFWPLNTTLYIKKYKYSTPIFSYFLLKSLQLNVLNAGSAVPTLNRNHVHILPCKIPPLTIINNFENESKKFFNKIHSNQTQIRTLQKLRDTLLPKLMSGEVRVALD